MNMVFRLVESLLITLFNAARRGWAKKPAEEPPAPTAAPPDQVVIGHVIPDAETSSDAIARDLLKRGIVALTPQARRRHLYVLGATGTGKTNLLLRLIESDIRNQRAFCVIDLRGDLIDRILLRLAEAAPPAAWKKRLLLLDLRDAESVVGFNPLAGESAGDTGDADAAGDAYTRALHLLDVLKTQSDSWGIQLEETLRNALLALASTGHTLLEVEPLLSNAAFRAQVLEGVTDSHVRNFFERFEALSAANKLSWTLSVLNKITPLLASPQLRLTFGQKEGFSFGALLDREPGMVILISLAVDRLHAAAHLTGGMLVSAFQSAMMARVDQKESERVPAFLYVDEFEMMASERFQEIVAEGRRFGVGLCLSHQNLSQLSPGLRNVLRNNVHTQLYFQTGAVDAADLCKEISGGASKDEVRRVLIAQSVGEAYLVRRGEDSLRIRTLHSPDPNVDAAAVSAIRAASLATYARPRAEVERELAERERTIKTLNETEGGKAAKGKASAAAPTYEIRHEKTSTFKPGSGVVGSNARKSNAGNKKSDDAKGRKAKADDTKADDRSDSHSSEGDADGA